MFKVYTLLGWLTWQGIRAVAKRKLGQNKVKLGAGATVLLALVAALVAAWATGDDDSS